MIHKSFSSGEKNGPIFHTKYGNLGIAQSLGFVVEVPR